MQSPRAPGPTKFENPTATKTDAAEIHSPDFLQVGLLCTRSTIKHDLYMWMKTWCCRNKFDQYLKVLNAPLHFTPWQYNYIDRPPPSISAVVLLETVSYYKLMPFKLDPSRIVEVSPRKLAVDEDGKWNTESIYRATLVPFAKHRVPRMTQDDWPNRQTRRQSRRRLTTAYGRRSHWRSSRILFRWHCASYWWSR